MTPPAIALRALLPLGMAGGLALAWLRGKSNKDDERPGWRDTSLDDWRAQRDQAHEEARVRRRAESEARPRPAEEEGEAQEHTQSRLG